MKKLILSVVAMFMVICLSMAQSSTYCSSMGNNSSIDYIRKVKLRHINNVTQSNAGYGNYTSLSTILTVGSYDTIYVKGSAGTIYNEGYGVWIDYNKDGDFEDATEQIVSYISPDSSIIAPFRVPDIVVPGTTRMRVAMKRNGIPTSCETFQFGEVEDYTINIACASRGRVADWEYIKRVRLRNLDIVSGPNQGYGDFSAMSANLIKGGYDTITITPKWASAIYSEGYSVWIDFNRDGDFTDSSEQVIQKPASRDTLIRGYFRIPASALLGPTKMRVSMKYNGIPTSCETFQYGEVEDYTVNIRSNERVYCESKGLNASEEYINSVWIASYFYNTSGSNGGYGNFTSSPVHVPNDTMLTIKINPAWTGTIYKEGYSVWMDFNRDGDFADSAEQVLTIPASTIPPDYAYFYIPVSVPLGPVRMRVSMKYYDIPTSCETFQYGEVEDYTLNIVNKHTVYCRSRGFSVANGYINRVQVNGRGIDNISGSNNGYGDFSRNTALIPVLVRDSSARITITPWQRVNNTAGIRAWIDYNGDGYFSNAEEGLLGIWPAPNPHVIDFQIPASAPVGKTRLRISMKIGGLPGSGCDSITNGEVEDYTVDIRSKVLINSQSGANQRLIASAETSHSEEINVIHLYPNPAKDYLNIRISENTVVKSIKVVSGTGTILHNVPKNDKRVDISALHPGIYLLIMDTEGGEIRGKFIKE